MSKKLNEDLMASELSGSAFFRPQTAVEEAPLPVSAPKIVSKPAAVELPPTKPVVLTTPRKADTRQSQNTGKATKTPLAQASEDASTLASEQEEMVETIRKTVKVIGKEVTFVRLTVEEKKQLREIAFVLNRSENEVARIGLNLLLEDYHRHGQTSVLASVIAALLA